MTPFTEAATSRTTKIRAGGSELNIHYNDMGQGPAIMMLHGSGPGASGWSNFHRNVDALAGAGYRVILADMPGWGKTDSIVVRDQWRSELNVEVIRGLMDHLKLDRAHLIGNSMGGGMSLAFALACPERVAKLVLMGSGGLGSSVMQPQPMEGIKVVGEVYRNPTPENVTRMLKLFVYDSNDLTDELLKTRFDAIMSRRDHLQNFVESQKFRAGFYPDQSPRLGEVKAPVLITWGRDDRFVPFDTALRALHGLPNADLCVFSRCGHWAQWEHPDKFNRYVIDFLKNG